MANVRVRWIDSISAAATGNKIYREDVEIADIANGIQEYIDTAAPDGATGLKYEVQAHDGAGDETTQEVEGENMDYIDTQSGVVDIYPPNNAASPIPNEGNATTSFNANRGGVITSESGGAANGSYWIKIVAGTQTFSGALQPLTAINGATYKITFDAKVAGGDGDQSLDLGDSNGWTVTQAVDITASTWTEYTITGTVNSVSPQLFWRAAVGSDVGGFELHIDNVRVEEQ